MTLGWIVAIELNDQNHIAEILGHCLVYPLHNFQQKENVQIIYFDERDLCLHP